MKGFVITGLLALIGGLINIGGDILSPYMPKTIFNTIVIGVLLMVFAIYISKKVKKEPNDRPPSLVILLAEAFKDLVDGLVGDTMGKNHLEFSPYILSLFMFLLVSNLTGLIGVDAPTSNYSVTLSLALVTFVMIHFIAIKEKGIGGYIKGYFEPVALLMPINLLGELATPISLSFRLFGNLLGGGIIMVLVYSFTGYLAPLIAPWLQMYFEIFSGVLQAFIFTMLTMVFVGGSLE